VMYGGSAVEFVKQISPAVTSVEVLSCAKAVVTTSLGADGSGDALRICQVAANAAHDHGVARTSVVTTDGKELASGTAAVDCKLTT